MQNLNQITNTSPLIQLGETYSNLTDQEMLEANTQLNLQTEQMLDQLISSAIEICKSIENKSEPVMVIDHLNQSLQNNHQAIWQYISQPANFQKKKDFYQKVFKFVTDRMLNEKVIQSELYLPQILRFFRNVLVNFFPYDIEDENISEVVHQIFNLDASLYTQALQQSQRRVGANENGDGAESLEQLRIKEENAWRIQLKEGDRLDAIKLKHQQQYRIRGWARGTIVRYINDDPDTFLIQFDNEPMQNALTTNRYGPQIAPEGTFTDDILWRDELQKGSELDCLDSENVWYKSTILDSRTITDHNNQQINQVYVGFRVYNEEEGHKIDDDGRKFIGWSNRYDEWRNLHCVTVQRLATISKSYKMAGRQFMVYDQQIDDLTDIIHNTTERKIWAIYRPNFFANLRCIADYLNEFGMRGGFEKILHFFHSFDQNKKVSLKHIQYLIDFLAKSQSLWHRQFTCSYIPLLKASFERAILTTNPQNNGPLQLQFLKETMMSCQKSFHQILKRHYTFDQHNQIMSLLQFQIGFSLLKSEKLEKRIQGIKEIAEQIKNIRFQMKKAISNQDIIEFLKKESFCEKIFGENYHIQLIQRSSDIIKFMFHEKAFGPRELEFMWQAALKDQQTKIEIYKIIQETSGNYTPDEKDYLIDKFSQISPEEFGEKELECVYELTKFIYKQSPQSLKAANLFWSIATREQDYKKQLTEVAIERFIDVTRNWDRQDKGQYPLSCIKIIKEQNIQSAIPAIKILQKMIEHVPTFKQNNAQNQAEFACFLIDEFHLFDLIIEEILVYQKTANELWAKGVIKQENIENVEILDQPFNHRSQIYLRLNFYRQMLTYSQRQVNQEHLDKLWDQMLGQSKISIDSELFFMWFKAILTDQNKISQEVMDHFFREKICSGEAKFTNIKRFGFECIQSMFLQINDYSDKLVINPQANNQIGNNNQNYGIGQGQIGVGNNNQNNNNNNASKVDFKVHVHPHELEGIDVIWRMLEDIDKKSADIIPQIILLITKVYLNLSTMMEDQIHQVGEDFTQECLKRFSKIAQTQAATFEEKSQLVKYLVTMMKSFFEDSEKNGTGCLRPHQALDKGDFYQRIVINNNITSMKTSPKYIEINTYSNMTLWELKKIIGQKTKTSPLKIQLNRSDAKQKSRAFTDNDNIKMLKDLRFDSFEVISAQKKQHQGYQQKVAIVNKKKQLVPEAKKIFTQWFKTFSNEDGVMTPETCVDFIKNSTNDPNVTAYDQRVTRLFDEHDKDKDGQLTLAEFLEFYREKACTRVELVWSNLTAHGVGHDLRPIVHNYSYDDDIYELKDKTLLARYKLSNNQAQFDDLFSLLESGYEEIWNLLTVTRTNAHIYTQILTQDDFLKNLDKQSIYKQLYSLQILEEFMNEHQLQQDQVIRNYFTEGAINDYPSLPNENSAPQSGHNNNKNMGSSNINIAKGDNIPDAPPMEIGPLPPPNLNNQGNNNNQRDKIFDTLDNFNGQIINEPIQGDLFSPEDIEQILASEGVQIPNMEIYKKDWLPKFLQSGGLELLITMLKNILEKAYHKKQEDVLKSKYEKELVNTLVKIIKVIVMSTFCAHSSNSELTIQLQRRISQNAEELQSSPPTHKQDQAQNNQQVQIDTSTNQQNNQENKAQQQKSKIQADQETTAKIYEPLINLLKSEIGSNVFSTLDFQSFQSLILNLILTILFKDKNLSLDDRVIIDQALSLWISLIVFNPNMFIQIQQPYQHKQDDIEQNKQQIISTILIEKGLLCQNGPVRSLFKEAFLFIAKQVKGTALMEAPQFYFLKQQITYLNNVLERTQNTSQYFELLRNLLAMYFEARNESPDTFVHIFDPKALLVEVSQKLHFYKSNEKKLVSYSEDCNLSGMIYIINMILLNNEQLLPEEQNQELLQEIVEKLLFSFNLNPFERHVTKEIKLDELEKPNLNKCCSTYSRTAAYNLLNTLCLQNPHFIGAVISKYWSPLINSIRKPKKQGLAPRLDNRAGNGFCGIRNLGCICYMNSMIQQFFLVPAFRYGIMSADDKMPQNMREYEGDLVDDNLLHQLIKYMSFLELSERQDYNPRDFCFAFKDFDNNPTNVRVQQDAQEFLNVLFDRVESQLRGTSQKYLLQNIFGGKFCSLMICKGCGNLRQTQEDFNNITVEVKNQKSIYEGLKKFTSGEIINDYLCEACNTRVDVERKTAIQQLPNMLIIHLQRIIFDFDTLMNAKLNSRVEFPNVLNMKSFMLSEVLKQEKELLKKARKEKKKQEQNDQANNADKQQRMEDEKDEDGEGSIKNKSPEKKSAQIEESQSEEEDDENMGGEQAEEEKDENYEYKLVGVVLHMGTADAGHYVSFININRGKTPESSPEWLKTEKDKWLEFNDSTVKDYQFSELEEDCFGGAQNAINTSGDFKNDYSRNAYMLIYEKRVKEKIKIVLPQDFLQSNNLLQQQISQSQQTLDCDGTAISRDQIASQINNTDTSHLLYICPQIKQQISEHRDIYFDSDKQETIALVDFNSIQKFVPHDYYKKQPSLLLEDSYSEQLFQFMEKLIFDIIAMTSDNKQLLLLVNLMISMLNQNEQQALKFIQERIMSFTDPKVIEAAMNEKKMVRGIFEMLTSNTDKDVREMAERFLQYAVNKLFQFNDIEKVDTIIDYALSLMPEELAKNWLKMHQYFQFFYNVSISGYQQMSYLNSKGIVSRFIDFFLENESPRAVGLPKRNQMGSNFANPPFDFLILLVVNFARAMPRIHTPSADVDSDINYQEYMQVFFQSNPASIFFFITYPNCYLILNPDDVQMLQLKQFYSKALRYNCQIASVAQLASHVAFENYDFSQRLAKKILLGINQCNGDEIKPYLDILQPFLFLTDSYSQQRTEWILGIPYLRIEKPMTNFNMMPNIMNYKVGVSAMTQINDDIYEYRSTLFKSSNSIKESLLQILYQYRKRWPLYTLQALNTLFNISFQDPQHKLMLYLQRLEPPTYSYARYIDWIRPYIQDCIISATRTRHMHSSQIELSIATNLNLSLTKQLQDINTAFNPAAQQNEQQQQIDQINDNQQNNQEEIKQNQESEVQSVSGYKYIVYDSSRDGGPEQYLIWKLQSEQEVASRQYPENITLHVYQYQAYVSESKPTANGNLILNNQKRPNNNYNNNNQSFQIHPAGGRGQNWNNNSNNMNNNMPFGRGRNIGDPAGQGSGKRRGRKNDQSRGAKKLKGKKAIQGNPQSEQDVGYGQQTAEEYSATGGGAVSDVQMADNENNRNDMRYNQNNGEEGEYEDEDIDSYDNNTNDGTMNSQYQDQEGFQDDKYQGDDTNINMGNGMEDQDYPQNQQNMQGVQNNYQSTVPEVQRKDSENNDFWSTSAVAILLFQVSNNDMMKNQKVVLTIKDLSENGQTLNFRAPATSIPCQINSNKEKDIVIFTKLRIFDDWGNYSYDLKVEQQQKNQGINMSSQMNNNNNNNMNHNMTGPYEAQQSNDFNAAGSSDNSNIKECPACTYHNPSSYAQCSICQTPLKW